jgi:ornithine decarboxylase
LDKKFGVPVEEAVELLAYAASRGLTPAGITFHVGSQCKSLNSWRSALEDVLSVWDRASTTHPLRMLNIGGGFPASHEEQWLQPGTIMDFVIDQVERTFPAGVELVAEPGRGLVADAGVLVTTVIGKGTRTGTQWVYVDVGVFNGLMEVIGGIGYKYQSVSDGPTQPWTVAGPSCDSMDVIAENVMLPDLQVGDRVVIYPAGAYTTAYAAPFNGAVVPNVVLT